MVRKAPKDKVLQILKKRLYLQHNTLNSSQDKHLDSLYEAAQAIQEGEILYIGAGAGMGVDSGLPDFRGTEGFWKAYPPVADLQLRFEEMANPRWFLEDPEFAWGFYGHRLNLYRKTIPHAGFAILRRWADAMNEGAFVYTSNVDGHFQRSGFEPQKVLECHGSLNHLQCMEACGQEIWSAENHSVEVDLATLRAKQPLPSCPSCGQLARPNVLMFGDWGWDPSRTNEIQKKHQRWLIQRSGKKVVVIEIGAGKAVPTVRANCESIVENGIGKLIRINLRDSEIPQGNVALPLSGLDGLRCIDEIINAEK